MISDIRNPSETFDPMFAYFSNWYRTDRTVIHFYERLTHSSPNRRTPDLSIICVVMSYLFFSFHFHVALILRNIWFIVINKYLLFGPSTHSSMSSSATSIFSLSVHVFIIFENETVISRSFSYIQRMSDESNAELEAQFISWLQSLSFYFSLRYASTVWFHPLNRNRYWIG